MYNLIDTINKLAQRDNTRKAQILYLACNLFTIVMGVGAHAPGLTILGGVLAVYYLIPLLYGDDDKWQQ